MNINIKIKSKFINGRPYHPLSQGLDKTLNKYIQNALISAKDIQNEKFDLYEIFSDFCNITTQKSIDNKTYSFRYNISCKQ